MAEKNNRRENTFRTKALPETELLEEHPIIEEKKKEEKPKKETTKKSDKPSKGKEGQKNKVRKESDGRTQKIIGILFICLAMSAIMSGIARRFPFLSTVARSPVRNQPSCDST